MTHPKMFNPYLSNSLHYGLQHAVYGFANAIRTKSDAREYDVTVCETHASSTVELIKEIYVLRRSNG